MHSRPEAERPLIVLGASARAMAQSARRAGWRVYTADLFADDDTREASQAAVRVRNPGPGGHWPSLARTALTFPAAPWCYTGGFENHPQLLRKLASERELAGNPADVVERIRDPRNLADAVVSVGMSYPETRHSPVEVPTDGSYLVKPLAGAGGRGIRVWTHSTASAWVLRQQGHADTVVHGWQRFVPGTPISAGYLITRDAVRLLGLTRQLVGAEWCHAPQFTWCGAVTLLSSDLDDAFARLGEALRERFGVVGAVGVDAVLEQSDRVHVLEVNPRPTASMELFERSGIASIAGEHMAACLPGCMPAFRSPPWRTDTDCHWAKAVVFANHGVRVTASLVASLHELARAWRVGDADWTGVADIPTPDQTIAAGAPTCTVFARGQSPNDSLHRVGERAGVVTRLLGTSRA